MEKWWVNTHITGIRVLQKLTFTELVKDSFAFYWISRTNTTFATTRHWPCTEPDESSPHIHPYFCRTDASIFFHVCLSPIMDLSRKRMCVEWIDLTQDRDRWRALEMRSWTFRSYKMRVISWWVPISFSRTAIHGVSVWASEPAS